MNESESAMQSGTNPIVVWANWYYFRPNEVVRFSRVESLCLLWPIRGEGIVSSAGSAFQLESGRLLVLPWGHDIEYRASGRRPFQLGTVHLIPDYRGSAADLQIRVNVEPNDFTVDKDRHDDPALGFAMPELIQTSTDAPRSLTELGAYAVRRFQDGDPSFDLLAALGLLFSTELKGLRRQRRGQSTRLDIVQEYILQNLAREIRIEELSETAGCSVSALERRFQIELGVSPKAWISRQRMQQALFLIQSTSLNVSEVAFQVGFKDPLYFSKVFKQHFGASPRNYLKTKSLVTEESV